MDLLSINTIIKENGFNGLTMYIGQKWKCYKKPRKKDGQPQRDVGDVG